MFGDFRRMKTLTLLAALTLGQIAAVDAQSIYDIKWNFTKFLIAKDGTILKRFESATAPESRELMDAIDAALK